MPVGRKVKVRGVPELRIEVDGPVLEAFLTSRGKVDIIQGPVGSGKTRAALARLFLQASEQIAVRGVRKSRWLITRPTGPELKTTIMKDFLEMFPEESGWGVMHYSVPMTFYMKAGDIEAEFVFLALDDEGDIRKLKSTNFTGAYVNEGQYVSLEMFKAIQERIGRYPDKQWVNGHLMGGATRACLIMDMNAADEAHWVPIMRGEVPVPDWFTADQRRQYALPVGKDGKPVWNFFIQPAALIEVKDASGVVVDWKPNPDAENTLFLPEDYYLSKIAGATKETIDKTCMNRTGALRGGKPVFPGFNQQVHVARETIEWKPDLDVVVGVDFGRTPAAAWMQTWGGRWFVLGEYYLEDVSADTFAPALRREMTKRMPGLDWARVRLFGDPAGSFRGQASDVTPIQVFRKHQMMVVEARAALRWTVRKEMMDQVLARMVGGFPGILLDPSCRMLISGFGGGFKWRTAAGRDGQVTLDEPVKNMYSHPMDALCYGLGGAGEALEATVGSNVPRRVETRVSQSRVFRWQRPNDRRAWGRA